jgi:ribulose-phosphate 3-epimerase
MVKFREISPLLPVAPYLFGETPLIELAPSILAADFAHLADQIQGAEAGGAALLHMDVMDGHFVPNLTIGPPLIASVRKVTRLPLDCHLMIDNPNDFIPVFADAGADWISVHQEACVHLHRTLELIKHHGLRAGVVINPATPVETLTDILDVIDYVLVMSVNPGFGGQKFIRHSLVKIARLATLRAERGLSYRIEIDGGVAMDTVADVVRSGAEVLVAGSAVFGKGNPKEQAQQLIKAATAATWQQV